MRYKLQIAYDGTDFCGWQIQPDVRTVQGELEEKISTVLGEDIRMYGASRTDSGVHARAQVARFDWEESLVPERFKKRLNSFLSDDVAIKSMKKVQSDFSARFDAEWKIYQYQINQLKAPLIRKFSWYFRQTVDFEVLNMLADRIEGEHNFQGFARKISDERSKICNILEANWEREEDYFLKFYIKGNRFIHTMVRALAGAMIEVGRGELSKDEFIEMLNEGKRIYRYQTAPAKGLTLIKIRYPGNI